MIVFVIQSMLYLSLKYETFVNYVSSSEVLAFFNCQKYTAWLGMSEL